MIGECVEGVLISGANQFMTLAGRITVIESLQPQLKDRPQMACLSTLPRSVGVAGWHQ